MKNLLLLLALATSAGATAPPYYGVSAPAAGKVTMNLSGNICVAASSASAGTCAVGISGSSGITTSIGFAGPNPWFDIMAFGAVADGSASGGTSNAVAIRAAIAAATATATGGGIVYFPPGAYYTGTSVIVVPRGVRLVGAGQVTTTLYSGSTGYTFQLGNDAAATSRGLGIEHMSIQLIGANPGGINLYGAVGAIVSDLYIGQVNVTNPHSNVCINVDGANASAYFNHIADVDCNHVQVGFRCRTTGSVESTVQYVTNLRVFGDDSTAPGNGSIGVDIGGTDTQDCVDSVFSGGNLESVTTGYMLRQNSGRISVFGTRFENQTGAGQSDVFISSNARAMTLIGLYGLTSGITDNSNIGLGFENQNNIIAAIGSTVFSQIGRLDGGLVFNPKTTGHTVYISTGPTGVDFIRMQAGAGSSSFGGGIGVYGAAHGTYPGDVYAGLSNGVGRFRVNSSGVDGGSDYLTVHSTGTVAAGYLQRQSRTIAQLLAITPSAAGQEYYCSNCSPAKLVVSTGTSAGNFADPAGAAFK